MLKKRSRAISIVVALMFCLSFMVPAFVTPDVAQASSTYEVISAPTLTTSGMGAQNLGVVKVKLADTVLINAYSYLTVSLPTDLKLPTAGPVISDTNDTSKITILARGKTAGDDEMGTDFFDKVTTAGSNEFDIHFKTGGANSGPDKYFYIYFNNINLNNTTGDIKVSFHAPSGSGLSSSNDLVIAKSSSSGSTTTRVKKVKDITDKGGALDSITIEEDAAGSFEFNTSDKPRFRVEILTNGFEWRQQNVTVTFGWSLDQTATVTPTISGSNNEKLDIKVPDAIKNLNGTGKTLKPCKVTIDGLYVEVDDNKAKAGDEVEVKVNGYKMDTATAVVAKYSDYQTTLVEGTTKTITAGQNGKEIGQFYIQEGAAGSLVGGRTIKFTLPSGVEWDKDNLGEYEVVSSGDITIDDPILSGDNDEVTKWEVDTPSDNGGGNDAVKIKFKDMKVNISPEFTGDLVVEVSGSAGVEGKVKVAEVKPAATIQVEKAVNVILGKANQKIGDITLVEGAVEGLMDDTSEKGKIDSSTGKRPSNSDGNKILLDLDNGYRFSKLPTVKVLEGDIDIDAPGIALRTTGSGINDGRLEIEVKSNSNKTASKILISDIYIDAFRTAPEGAISIEFAKGVSAVNETRWDSKSPGKAVIANCVTAAMGDTVGNGQFVIGSNIFEMNGVKKVMDAAPYVKNARTYVPVRYLGYVLGLSDDDIVWDQAAQKVTFTKGDNTVELVIGSTTITVNGEEQVMDVAPEISNDRTMLPARYVAEGFGFTVGWDAVNQIVLISK